MARSACLSDDDVALLAEGKFPPDRLASAEEHLARCDVCAELVAAVAGALVGDDATTGPGSGSVPVAEGSRVGRYVVLAHLGEGGMGSVYAALDPSLDRKIALKLVRADRGGHELQARLLREAKAMARLSHPDVVTVFDVGTHGDELFIAMELVDGGTLRGWLAEAPRTFDAVLDAFVRAGRGLARAHAAGIVHRDFKPDNVLVGRDGRVRVTDFGLARAIAEPAAGAGGDDASPSEGALAAPSTTVDATLTRTGTLVGTPAYLSPEQHEGKPADARSDLYGFCVALWEALYGQRPFAGATLGELHREKRAERLRPGPGDARVPSAIRRVLEKGLRADPAARHASMEALLDALERAARPRRRGRMLAGALVAGALLAAVPLARARRSMHLPEPPRAATASAADACATNRECVDRHGGAPFLCRRETRACVALASTDCRPRFEPDDLRADDVVWLGAMFPRTGPAAEDVGTMNFEGVDLARAEIARATAALTGPTASTRVRRIALLACDDAADPMRAARHLVDEVGVPAIVGFGSGQTLVDVAGSLLVKRGVLTVASLTSSPLVTRVPQPASMPRMVFRTTYSLDQVAEAVAAMVHGALEARAPRRGGRVRVTLARPSSAAGQSFAEALFRTLEFNGARAVDQGGDYQELTFATNASGADAMRATADAAVAHAPSIVVVLGAPGATVPLVAAIESGMPKGAPAPIYVVANDSLELFAPFLGADADRRRRTFAIQSTSSSVGNARLVMRYNATHARPVTRTINPAVSYDAFYLLAYATFALGDAPVDGVALARAIERLQPPGRAFQIGPTDLLPAIDELSKSGRIDLQGTQTPLDFDLATGEAPSDFALLCAAVDARGRANGEDVESGLVYRPVAGRIEGSMRCP